ncbi:MAG: hypothetical protein MUF72_19385 [Elainella sp. Prado103]|jgi:hypothetical protein|nr:hypothetical protein [Elainella sp. Prado103]
MKLRLAFLGALLSCGLLGYWGHDLPQLHLPAEALPEQAPEQAADLSESIGTEPDPSSTISDNPELSDKLIDMAHTLADRSRYVDAITLLETIPSEDSNFSRANQLQDQWGRAILSLGQTKLKQGKIAAGKAILKSIPSTTEAYTEAAALLRHQKE